MSQRKGGRPDPGPSSAECEPCEHVCAQCLKCNECCRCAERAMPFGYKPVPLESSGNGA